MDSHRAQRLVDELWDESIVPTLIDYIRIPNKSPLFDPDWEVHGYMDEAVALIAGWCRAQELPGLSLEIVRLEGRTPLILMEIEGSLDDTVLLYGHLDKQPEMVGWAEGLGPWEPVLRGDKLYGRGGADDGYAAFASLAAIKALKDQGVPHARCVILIEACEESGSPDLPAYIDALSDRIGTPSLVVCLDSGCGNYDQLWCTTSLRGMVVGNLVVEILEEGVHSGDASGIVPSSFRIARRLLSRLEDEDSGEVLVAECQAEIPAQRRSQAKAAAEVLGELVYAKFPFIAGAAPVAEDGAELILNRTWRPALSITGADGLPGLADAGNVLRAGTSLKISLRLPPTSDAVAATARVKALLEQAPPYGSQVSFDGEPADGWNAPPLADWLGEAAARASNTYFGRPSMYMGEGGSIPFMAMLGESFPDAQFFITGVLGPGSNAHGPNEFLHIPMGKRLTCCVAQIIEEHGTRPR